MAIQRLTKEGEGGGYIIGVSVEKLISFLLRRRRFRKGVVWFKNIDPLFLEITLDTVIGPN